VRWEDLPELLRAEAGCLRLPVAVRGTDAINLAEYLHPDRMDFWGDLEGFLELEPDDPRIIELRRRYARPEDDDEAPGWVFPEPITPGEVVASQRKPRPTSKAAPGWESSGAAPGPGGAEPGPKPSWWARWLGLWRGKT
jgi:hypothetical protein